MEPPAMATGGGRVRRPDGFATTLGVISIVLGSLGLVCWGCNTVGGIIGAVTPDTLADTTTTATAREVPADDKPADSGDAAEEDAAATSSSADAAEEDAAATSSSGEQSDDGSGFSFNWSSTSSSSSTADLAIGFVSWGLSIWLLVAGIMMVQRRASAAGVLKAWAIVRLLVLVAWLVVTFMTIITQVEEIQAQLAAEAAKGDESFTISDGMLKGFAYGFMVFVAIILAVWPIIVLIVLGRSGVREQTQRWGQA
jgi:hypothetical protein